MGIRYAYDGRKERPAGSSPMTPRIRSVQLRHHHQSRLQMWGGPTHQKGSPNQQVVGGPTRYGVYGMYVGLSSKSDKS